MLRFPLRDSVADAAEPAGLVSAAAGISLVGDFMPAAAAVVRGMRHSWLC